MVRGSGLVAAAVSVAILAAAAGAEVSAEVPANLKAKGSLRPAGDRDEFRFHADAGSLLDLKLAAAGRADLSFGPVLRDPGGLEVPLTGAVAKGKTWRVRKLPLAATGVYGFTVRAEGTGDYALKLKAKGPVKGDRTLALDVRAATLGRPGGGELFLRAVVGPEGGTLSSAGEPGDLAGAALEVPAGTVPGGTVVTLASAPVPGGVPTGTRLAGPTLQVGPAGLAFAGGAVVTLPYDPVLIPAVGGVDELGVLLVEGKDAPRVLPPDASDPGLATAELSVPGACVLAAAAPDTLPALAGTGSPAEFWLLSLGLGLSAEPDGDSRHRHFDLALGSVFLQGNGTGSAVMEGREFSIRNDDGPGPGSPPVEAGFESSTGTESDEFGWSYAADGLGIEVQSPDAPRLRSDPLGNLLVGKPAHLEPRAGLDLLVRKGTGLSMEGLAGTWHLAGVEVAYDGTDPGGAARLRTMRMFGTVAPDGKGGARLNLSLRETAREGNSWTTSRESVSATVPLTLRPDGALLLDLTVLEGDAPRLLLFPGPAAGVLLGTERDYRPGTHLFLVAVRQGASMGVASLRGTYRGATVGCGTDQYFLPGEVQVGDLSVWDEWLRIEATGSGSVEVASDEWSAWRDPEAPGGVRVETGSETFTVGVSVSKQGRVAFKGVEGAPVGALSPDGSVLLLVSDPAGPGTDTWIGVLARSPSAAGE